MVRDDAAVQHVDDAVGALGDGGFVGDHQHGEIALAAQVGEQIEDPLAGDGVEAAGGFVGEQDGRVVGESAGDGDALTLAAGELGRALLVADVQADGMQQLVGLLLALARR